VLERVQPFEDRTELRVLLEVLRLLLGELGLELLHGIAPRAVVLVRSPIVIFDHDRTAASIVSFNRNRCAKRRYGRGDGRRRMLTCVDGGRSIRRGLLFRSRRRDGDGAERQLELFRVEPSPSRAPVLRGELEVPIARPIREDPDDLGEVQLGVEVVELAGRDERQNVAGGGGVVIGAVEQKCTTCDGNSPELSLGGIVLHPEPAIFEEPGGERPRGGWRTRGRSR
jgi:hypothetical protein